MPNGSILRILFVVLILNSMFFRLCFVVFLFWVFAGPVESTELKILAAKSFREPLKEISEYFEGKNPGTKVELKFAKTANVVRMLDGGAKADVILLADSEISDRLKEKGLIDEKTLIQFVSAPYAIITTSALKEQIKSPEDLTGEKFQKIAVYKQSTQAGRRVTEYLRKIGLFEKVVSKIMEVENVKAAFDAVSSGQAQCLFAYPFEMVNRPTLRVAWQIPAADIPSIVYWIGMPAKSTQKALAQSYIEALLSTISRKIFENAGYTVLAPPVPAVAEKKSN